MIRNFFSGDATCNNARPTTLGLAALLLLALGGLYLSHVSLAADPAHHAPQGAPPRARLRATEQRAAAAEKLAADAIAHAREMRLARDAAAAGRPARPRRRPPSHQRIGTRRPRHKASRRPSSPGSPRRPPCRRRRRPPRTPGPPLLGEPPAPPKRVRDGGASTEKKLTIAQSLGCKRETIADRVLIHHLQRKDQ